MDIFFTMLLLFVVSLVAGIIGALTGLGGGTFLVPILNIFLSFPLHLAIGDSLVSTIITSISSSKEYLIKKISNPNIAISLLTATTLGAIFGSLTNNYFYTHNLYFVIYISFGLILLSSSLLLIVKNLKTKYHPDKPDKTTFFFNLFGKYKDGSNIIYYDGVRWYFGWIIMLFAGFVSGLLGIGSGVLKVLGLDLIMNLPIKVSTTTSNFMIGVTADNSSILYLKFGYIPFLYFPISALGVLFGAIIGTKLLLRLNDNYIRSIFILFVSYLGIKMLLEGINYNNNILIYLVPILISVFSILLGKIKRKEEYKNVEIEEYIKENQIDTKFTNILYNMQKYFLYVVILLSIISIIIVFLYNSIIVKYNTILYLFIVTFPFLEVVLETIKYIKEKDKKYAVIGFIVIINLIIGLILLPNLIF
ncbi:hypothetical protein MJ1_0249 [Nanobdella aerobiophila]|uniref:Probable membrane transporter protein n=1 Tax=Nanobdella aerobiophila TaxID=2586965 RepID=A0A915SF22_9ARCH|nr:sulfite exporter TauE/SafE family protein [Nanobdella aerobiophila]BBL45420.1 hypothetical protein MJ1_0249 [Nanobdella aerobiophila]